MLMKAQLLIILLAALFTTTAIFSQDLVTQKELDKIHRGTYQKRDSLLGLHRLYLEKLQRTNDTFNIQKELQNKLDEIGKAIEQNKVRELMLEFDFVKQHLSSPVSLHLLNAKLYKREAVHYYDTFFALYDSLTPELQNSDKGKQLQEALSHLKKSGVGRVAPEFSGRDINNKELSLSSFRSKNYVLIDFWASWCVPCRQDFPFLKQAYEQYHSKGLEIISVSTDEDLEKWKTAIAKDGVGQWKHFFAKQNSSLVAVQYFVAAIPVKVLIDKEGNIIARWRGGGEENKESLKKTLHELFD